MAYGATLDGTLGMEIYTRYVDYCTAEKVIPEPYVFWRRILVERDQYPISKSGFQHWLMRLQMGLSPLIWRDQVTGAWRLRDVDIRGLT